MRLSIVVLAGCLAARSAETQAVRGQVVGADAGAVAGAIVTLLDSAGTPLARALADDQGRFSIRMPAAGRYRFEVLRIGYAPTLDEEFRVDAGQVVSRTLRITGSPVALAGVRVSAPQRCLDGDTASPAFAVWEEARKALMASQLTRATRAYTMDVERFTNRQASDIHLPPTVRRVTQRSSSLRPFSTPPPEQLADEGYVERRTTGDLYHAPDEDVLLSPSFEETHCLKLLPDSGAPGRIRLGFSPAPDRHLADIRGVLTVDRETSELREVEFVYVNLRPVEQVGSPGGELVFRRLPEGSWIIEYWAIGVPFTESRVNRDEIRPVPGRGGVPQPSPRPATVMVSTGRITTGGGVSRVAFGDTTVWQADEPVGPRIRVPLPPE